MLPDESVHQENMPIWTPGIRSLSHGTPVLSA